VTAAVDTPTVHIILSQYTKFQPCTCWFTFTQYSVRRQSAVVHWLYQPRS